MLVCIRITNLNFDFLIISMQNNYKILSRGFLNHGTIKPNKRITFFYVLRLVNEAIMVRISVSPEDWGAENCIYLCYDHCLKHLKFYLLKVTIKNTVFEKIFTLFWYFVLENSSYANIVILLIQTINQSIYFDL